MKRNDSSTSDANCPSRHDIQDACRQIQQGWSDNERRKRAGMPRWEPWNPPMIPGYQIGAEFDMDTESV